MIELTREQQAAIDTEQQPATAVDPRTGQRYRLIREEIYYKLQGLLPPQTSGKTRCFDDPVAGGSQAIPG
jgi:hypothetical protein